MLDLDRSSLLAEPVKVTKTSVVEAIIQLPADKSYYDGYRPDLLLIMREDFSGFFADLMTDFINAGGEIQGTWLKTGENFLHSYIKPIVKGTDLDATRAKSYRPISVSHTLCVLFERVIANIP